MTASAICFVVQLYLITFIKQSVAYNAIYIFYKLALALLFQYRFVNRLN